jgi:hypothetical protein
LAVADKASAEVLALSLEVGQVVGADWDTVVAVIRESKAVLNSILIGSAVLALVGSERSIPLLCVHRAVLALGYTVFQEDVSVEVAAELGLSSRRRVCNRIAVLFLAGSSTELGIEGTFGEQFIAHVGPLLVAVKRGIDRTVFEINLLVAISGLGLERGVSVASCDGDLELLTPLTLVSSGVGVDRSAPEGAFDIGDCVGIGAGGAWGL